MGEHVARVGVTINTKKFFLVENLKEHHVKDLGVKGGIIQM
jgi:hypothetical protein